MAKNIPKCLIIEFRKQDFADEILVILRENETFFVNFMHSDMCRLEAIAEESFDEWHKD